MPSPFAFGGEEGLEDVLERLLIHAAAAIGDRQQRVVAGNGSRMVGAVGCVEGGVAGFDGDRAHSADGVAGVDAQVGEDLVDLDRVHLHGPRVGAWP